ncbi:tetratricopeptide repeat protein [Candidatus Gracilibacteria bacterium]|nr:tetratricopeptide repeat protein [Candidatus Gracilibacteria bacterium]
MKKLSFLGTSIGLGLVILGSLSWIFQDEIKELFQKDNTLPTVKKGVERRISYIGRIKEAKQLMEHEYFSLSTIELQTAIAEKPDLIQPYLILGEIYLRTLDLNRLENLISELKNKFPNDREIAVLEGRKLITEKKFSEALEILELIDDDLPPALKFYQAVLLGLQNNHTQAQEILTELKNLPVESRDLIVGESGVESEDLDSNSLTPEVATKINSFTKVYDDFSKLSEGKNPHLFALLAKSLASNNEAVLAKEFAEIAIKEDISYIDAWIVRGYANLQMKETTLALQDLRHAYELDPIRPQTHYFLALALYESGQSEEAILFFEKALAHDFEFSAEVRWKLIELFSKAKRYDRVLELYQELLDEDSNPKEFASALHTAIDILKKPEIALEIAEKLVANKPNDIFALNMQGWALTANKKFIQAEKVLKEAKKLNPDYARTYLNLGLLYEQQSKFLEAKEFYKTSYDLGKNNQETSLTNLSAEKYNELSSRTERPEEPSAPTNPENSP